MNIWECYILSSMMRLLSRKGNECFIPGHKARKSFTVSHLSTLSLYSLEDSRFLGLFLWFYFCWGSWHISSIAPEVGVSHSLPKSALRTTTLGKRGAVQGLLRGIKVMWGVKCRFLSSARWCFPGMRLICTQQVTGHICLTFS